MLFVPIHIIIIAIFFVFPFIRFVKHKANLIRIAGLFFLFLYTIILVKAVIFPIYLKGMIPAGPPAINVVPFKSIIETFIYMSVKTSLIQVVGNIVLFIPLGFLIPIINGNVNKLSKIMILIFSVSLSIELVQFFISLAAGVPSHVTDIDDIILNFIGGIIGYFVYLIINKFILSKFELRSEE